MQGLAQGHTARESHGQSSGSLPGSLDSGATEKCSDGRSPSPWRERVGDGKPEGTGREGRIEGPLAPHQRCFHGSVGGEPGSQPGHQLAV